MKNVKIKLDVKSGFFIIIDFTKLNGKEFNNEKILIEEYLLLCF